MKKIILLTVFAALCSFALLAQSPPNPPENAGGSGGPVGGGAPIGSGIVLLITLAAGYGAKKVFQGINADKEENYYNKIL
jgi:hypothetical protein